MPRDPVDELATPEARDLLRRIREVAGRTLSGQHNTPRELSFYSDQASGLMGRRPAVWGQDFGFSGDGDMDGVEYRPAVVDEAIRQHATGSIVTLMWHAVRPTEDEPVTFEGSICAGPLPPRDWRDLLDAGSAVHARWERQVDEIAGHLARLQDAAVPVLWRPYHEMNGDWFWWGGRPGGSGSAALYRMLHERLVGRHGLHNLVWVWNANAPRGNAAPFRDFYPGHDVVDVLAADVYANDYRRSHHDELLELGEGRPIALGEVGVMPTPEILTEQPQWAWYMTWTDFLTRENDPDDIRRLVADPRVVSLPLG